ncbi:UNVERIFIED_CONTAM: Retrovirus-related Pol polyprotein from transposon RE2 [Sesamum radiatum]|uniref:Retrovirus-related Pol polyprotein from transposon RE2 n=1 Tax=Sesamum radiatum TaxID=300843 RepID=A0AAW2JNS5_SESRA
MATNETGLMPGSGSGAASGTTAVQESEDLKIHTSDFPSMVLVSTPLVGNNYLMWNRSVKVALTAKMKLSFIDGTYLKPIGNVEECKQCIRTDSMSVVTTRIQIRSSEWTDDLQLTERNGIDFSRNMDVVSYYTQLTMLWDELECVDPTPDCSCSSQRSMVDKIASTQLMQFLMGLNDSFDAIRSQILVMDPLPIVDKAYSLVLRVESQRLGHSRDMCFKLHGFPDWFKDLTEQRKRNVNDSKAFTAVYDDKQVPQQMANAESLSLMMNELLHLMKGKAQTDHTQDQMTKRTVAVGKVVGKLYALNNESFNANVIKKLPTSVLQWRTPYEVLYHRPVDYSVTKVFGCLAFAANVQPHKSKFTKRAHRCIFVGYALGKKGYKLYDLDDESSATPAYSSPAEISTSLPVDNSSSHSHSSFRHISTETLPDFPRRSTRTASKPVWMNDFVCSSLHSVNVITHVAPSHSAFVASLSQLEESKTYNQARQHSEWREAMNAKLKALKTNHTWELVPLPHGKTAIGCRWIFKLKLKADGSVDRDKARLVAKGYNQAEGIDYNESFSPVS